MPALSDPWFLLPLAALVGACIGSFLNVCIYRWPLEQSVIAPRSRCPHCGRTLPALENIPILSWLFLRGRCRGCRARISVQYPLVELTVAIIWLGAAWYYGGTFTALRVAVFLTVLLGIAITDAKSYLIPDGFTLFGLGWMLLTAFLAVFVDHPSPFATSYDAIIGAFTGAGVIAIAGWLGEIAFGREAMGFGDVTLMAVAGAALGPNRALLTIFLAAAIGVIVFVGVVYPLVYARSGWNADGTRAADLPLVPFGVFLAPAAAISLLWGNAMIAWYTVHFLAKL